MPKLRSPRARGGGRPNARGGRGRVPGRADRVGWGDGFPAAHGSQAITAALGRHRGLGGCLSVVVVLIVVVSCAALLGDGGQEQADGGGGQQAASTPSPAPTPSSTPEPTPTPEPESKPEPVEEPKTITLSGSSQEATEPFQLERGLTVIEMQYQGNANFIVDLLDQQGDSVAPMGVANVIGNFEGSTPVQITQGGQHLLDVQASGPWRIKVRQPRASSAPKTTSFKGTSAEATDLFELSGSLHRFELTHSGDENFIVDLLDQNGESVTMMGLVNEIGSFEGSKAVQVPEDGIYLLSVQANGPWTVKID